jgi:DNA-binding transcriptional LysR family regulator
MPNGHLEGVLLAVASGGGIALLPESVSERYAAPAARFLALDGHQPTFATALVTLRDTTHMPTLALLRAVSQAGRSRALAGSRSAISLAA